MAGDFRRTVHSKLIAMEERQIAAERRTKAAKERIQLISSDVEAARSRVARLIAVNQRLKSTMKSEEEWSKKGRRGALKGVVLGPVTLEVLLLFPVSVLSLDVQFTLQDTTNSKGPWKNSG